MSEDELSQRALAVAGELDEGLAGDGVDEPPGLARRGVVLSAHGLGPADPEHADLERARVVALEDRGLGGRVEEAAEVGLGAEEPDAVAALAPVGLGDDGVAAQVGAVGDELGRAGRALGRVAVCDHGVGQDARAGVGVACQGVEDGALALADDAAAGLDAGVGGGPDERAAMPDREPGEPGDERRVEHGGGPPLVVAGASDGVGELSPARAGGEAAQGVEAERDGGEPHDHGGPAEEVIGADAPDELGDRQGDRCPKEPAEGGDEARCR